MADDEPTRDIITEESDFPNKGQSAGSTSGEENYGSTKRQAKDPSSLDDHQSGKR
jgi:hypothetical protein